MSELVNYKIRNYEENDVVKEIEIYNKVIKSFDHKANEYTVENMDYRYKNEKFDPQQVKVLIDTKSNEVVGYSAVDFTDSGEARIEYPFILEEHRTEILMNKLFKEALSFAKSKSEKVLSDPYRPSSPMAEFLIKNYGASVHDTYKNYVIDVEKLNYDISPAKAYDVTVDKLEKINTFIKNAKKPTGSEIKEEFFKKQFEEGNYSPNRLKIIKLNEEIVGVIGASIEKTEKEGEAPKSRLNFYIMDLDHPNANEFRKVAVGSLYSGLKEEGVKEFITGIGDTSPAKPIFEKLGFTEYDEGFTHYQL